MSVETEYPVFHVRWHTQATTGATRADDLKKSGVSYKHTCEICGMAMMEGDRYVITATERSHHRFANVLRLCAGCARKDGHIDPEAILEEE